MTSMESGATLKEFKSSVAAMFERRGYDAMRPWRLETIYRTNMQSAFQGGPVPGRWLIQR